MRISGVGIARAGKKIRGQIDKKDKQFEHNSLKETVKEQKIEKAISIYERTLARRVSFRIVQISNFVGFGKLVRRAPAPLSRCALAVTPNCGGLQRQ